MNPTTAPPILENIPSIIVAFNIFSIKPVTFNNIRNIKYNIENIIKNAIN